MFPKQKGSYQDLTQTMTNLINFASFSVPFTGGSICGYQPELTDQELCARYFQLAVVSPLAIMDNTVTSQDWMPYTFDTKPKQAIMNALN